ncbi:MAG: lamin tail domain-containing protein, partial [Verrucomicrobia bacterium]|nr:lamin tail domain-containing protein [Verrucomicrobiota bacterium]
SNTGERLQLRDINQRVMDELKYGSDGSWPVGPDGAGLSLAKRDPNSAAGRAENWTSSAEIGGTPGRKNFPDGSFTPPPGVLSYWNFDEAGGGAQDIVGGNSGALSSSGLSRAPGLVGAGSLLFAPAGNGSVSLGRAQTNLLSVKTGFTVEAVVKPSWNAAGRATLFRKEADRRGSLVSYWSFDEANTGTNVAIEPVSGNNAFLKTGSVRTNGLVGAGAWLFKNATTEGLNVGTGLLSSFSFTTGITVAAWIRPQWSGASNTYDAIFYKDDSTNRIVFGFQNDASNAVGVVSIPPGPVLSLGLNVGGVYSELDMPLDGNAGRPTLDQLKDGAPHHVAGSYDSSSGTSGIWVDGALRYSAERNGAIRSGGNAAAFIGNKGGAGGQPFTGVIDELAIWSSALPAESLARLASGVAPPEVMPVGDPGNRVQFGFRLVGDSDFTDPPITTTPALAFGMKIGGSYREVEAALDGQGSRPALAALNNGAVHHLAAGYTSAAKQLWIAVDGTVIAASAAEGAADMGGIGLGFIGNASYNGSEAFSGSLDEVVMWDRGLDEATLALHAEQALAGRPFYAPRAVEATTLAFNELPGPATTPYWIELANTGSSSVNLQGLILARAAGGLYVFPPQTLEPGGLVLLKQSSFGFHPKAGDLLTLYTPGRQAVIDAVKVGTGPIARVEPGVGPWRVPTQPTAGTANTFAFHDEIVINEIMYHAPPVYSTPVEYTNITVVPIESDWKFQQAGKDLGTAWRDKNFDDSTWPVGSALFYNTSSNLPAAKNTQLALGPLTYYFRKAITLNHDPSTVTLKIRTVVDDGAVVYLNGFEVYRVGMKTGPVAYTNLATLVVNATLGPVVNIPVTNLVAGANVIAVEVHQNSPTSDDVVFGLEVSARVPFKPARKFQADPEQWIELYNRSGAQVDLSGWRFTAGVDFQFPQGSLLAAGGYLVVAADPGTLSIKYPSLNPYGPWTGKLSGGGDRLVLSDPSGNPADEVRFNTSGYWPSTPAAGGSSLELKDPFADNSRPEAWAGSDESKKAEWVNITYTGAGKSSDPHGETAYNELVIGLLDTGVAQVDDVKVRDLTGAGSGNLIQNSDFEAGIGKWRVIGNHAGTWDTDPFDPTNHVMRIVAEGMTEHMSNHAETTLKDGAKFISLADDRNYQISLRARWVSGSPQLNTRLFFIRAPKTTILPMPKRWGTPGARNSTAVDNLGPTYEGFGHSPTVPKPGEPVEIRVKPSDPQGVTGCVAWWTLDGTNWTSASMAAGTGGKYTATLPPAAAGKVVQFYVEATDGKGATSTFPPDGRDSRALYQVEDGQAKLAVSHNLRLIMMPADTRYMLVNTNQMSNGRMGMTAIYDERDVVYDAGIRLKGSEHGRHNPDRVSYNVDLPGEQLFRGIHSTIGLDRSGGWRFGRVFGQDEIVINHIVNHAGGTPAMWNDLVRIIGPDLNSTGSAILQMARYGPTFLDSQYDHGSANPDFEYELYYGLTEQEPNLPGLEGLKFSQDGGPSGFPLGDMGDDKEFYRLGYIFKNARDKDDLEGLMQKLKIFGLTDAAFVAAADQNLDVDEWLRAFALAQLCGVGDHYSGSGAQHNLHLYVRPSDGRLMHFLWDMDFAFTAAPDSDIFNNGDLARLVSRFSNKRVYYGHILDILETTYNGTYMAYWVDHYDNFTSGGQDFSDILTYIKSRNTAVRTLLPKFVPFSVASNGGAPFVTNSPIATISGRAWIDVKEIRQGGSLTPLDVSWTSISNWTLRLPLMLGSNTFVITAHHRSGRILTNASFTVVGASPTGGVDTDGDGIPDAWENIYDLNPLVPSADVDSDRDGFTDLQEYLAGTDPRNAQSRLRIESVTSTPNGAKIAFAAIAGRGYRLEYRDSLSVSGWKPLTTVAPAVADHKVEWVDSELASRQRFYRLVTPAE